MRRIGWVLSILALTWGVGSGVSWAEEPEAPEQIQPQLPAALEEEPEYSFGVVKSASATEIVVSEFDYDTGQDKEVAYSITPETEWENVASPSEVKAGDEVDVDYLVKDGKNVAVLVAVAKPLDEGIEVEGD